MARTCVFCGKPARSKEHIIPQWVSKVLAEDPRGFSRPINIKFSDDKGVTMRQWSSKRHGAMDYEARLRHL
jgi:hypothetical protein